MHPEQYADRHERVFEQIAAAAAAVARRNDRGDQRRRPTDPACGPIPRRCSRELPPWMTAAGNPRTFERAGAIGATCSRTCSTRASRSWPRRSRIYREARAPRRPRSGSRPRHRHAAHVPRRRSRDRARAGARAVLRIHQDEHRPAEGARLQPRQRTSTSRRCRRATSTSSSASSTSGSSRRARCSARRSRAPTLAAQLYDAGVDEIACLVDFGPPTDDVLRSLPHLARLRDAVRASPADRRRPRPAPAIAAISQRFESRCAEQLAAATFYRRLAGARRRVRRRLAERRRFWRRDGEALARAATAAGRRAADGRRSRSRHSWPPCRRRRSSARARRFSSPWRCAASRSMTPDAVVAWSHATARSGRRDAGATASPARVDSAVDRGSARRRAHRAVRGATQSKRRQTTRRRSDATDDAMYQVSGSRRPSSVSGAAPRPALAAARRSPAAWRTRSGGAH